MDKALKQYQKELDEVTSQKKSLDERLDLLHTECKLIQGRLDHDAVPRLHTCVLKLNTNHQANCLYMRMTDLGGVVERMIGKAKAITPEIDKLDAQIEAVKKQVPFDQRLLAETERMGIEVMGKMVSETTSNEVSHPLIPNSSNFRPRGSSSWPRALRYKSPFAGWRTSCGRWATPTSRSSPLLTLPSATSPPDALTRSSTQ